MTYREEGELFAEHQGPFAPELLPDVVEPTVFSRRFTDGEKVIDISASPVIPDRYALGQDEMPSDAYDVGVCVETRNAEDEGGDTSDYEWDVVNHNGLTIEQAIEEARDYITRLDPARDL